ncbi:hypothetical protein OROMI_007248 [Orobanche minor]
MHSILRRIHFPSNDINGRIKALVQKGHYQEALEYYSKESSPLNSPRFTFPSLLKACASLSYFRYGETLHCTITKVGLHYDPFIITSLVRMYGKCGSLSNATKLFDEMSQCEFVVQDVAFWNSIIDGYFRSGVFEEGMTQFRRMQVLNVKPDGYTLCIFLGICKHFFGNSHGKELHGYVVKNMFDDDPFVITAMIDMYSNSSRLLDAWNVFKKFENKYSIAVWNSMIKGFSENGIWIDGLHLYSLAKNEGLEFNSTTFSSVLTACSQGETLDFGTQIHSDVVKTGFESDPYVSTSILTFYSRCGLVESAERIFSSARDDRAVGIWNSMISAYVNCGCADDALDTYIQMRCKRVAPDSFTISNALIVCGMTESCYLGMVMHGELIKRSIKGNVSVQSALLTMYSKFGRVGDAYKVFSRMKEKDVIAWGSMISACCENNIFEEALSLYKTMKLGGVKVDSNVIASAIVACVGNSDEKLGCCIHGSAVKEGLDLDAFMGCTLMQFYSKLGQPETAMKAFSNIPQNNLVLWNSLMSSYSENGFPDVSISLLPQILQDVLYLDSISITTMLSSVSQMAALLKGKSIHGYHIKFLLPKEIQVENALIDMYTKCGCFEYAHHVFKKMPKRDIVAWNTMIAGYGSHNECQKALDLFHEMRNSGTPPDEITFLALISSCNHNGFVDEGLNLFRSMREHKIEPKTEHYINIVDLLGRAGCLNEAFKFIEEMGIEPDRGIWLSLLSACRVHRNTELGELAANNLIKTDPERGCNYIQLSNLFQDAGLKENAANVRVLMRHKGLTKAPGCSWIEVKNKVDVFFSGDSFSDRTTEIYQTLDSLKDSMKRSNAYELIF